MEKLLKVLQFGEGNFLRAFADVFIQKANDAGIFNGNVTIIKPRKGGSLDRYLDQGLEWNVVLRGKENGQTVNRIEHVSCVSMMFSAYDDYHYFMLLARSDELRFVISNTTEAGIVYDERDSFDSTPPETFPGKVTKFLYERFVYFGGDRTKGLIFLPVELIDDNGYRLRECVLKHAEKWGLGAEFIDWVKDVCIFCSTLVDRIVSGYPEDAAEICEKLGYEDKCLVAGEPYASWVIECDRDIRDELCLQDAGLPVVYTNSLADYKKRKVRILNGAHTSFALASYLKGNAPVGESMNDELIRRFVMRTLETEVMPTVDMPKDELESYAAAVIERFENPYIRHLLLSISLNSLSKWRTRCLPTVLDYEESFGAVPACLSFSMAALLAFYTGKDRSGNVMKGSRDGEEYTISDDLEFLEKIESVCTKGAEEYVHAVLTDERIWGMDLTEIAGFEKTVADGLSDIRENGIENAMKRVLA